MHSNFPKGAFFRELRVHLVDAGQPELADQIHQHYLAINVPKHWRSSSYEKLGQFPTFHSKFKHLDKGFFDESNIAKPEGFIDLTALRFLDRLIKTLRKHTIAS